MTALRPAGPVSGEILPGIHRIDAVFDDRFASLYLFEGQHRAVLYDTGVAGSIPDYLVPYAQRNGLDLDRIEQVVVSHLDVDHFGGVGDVARWLPNARVLAHELDAGAMEDFDEFLLQRGTEFAGRFGLVVDAEAVEWMRGVIAPGRVSERMQGGRDIDLGDRVIRVLHAPGHSLGHLVIHDPRRRLLAVSDAILGEAVPTADGAPGFPPTYRHEQAYLQTIELARDLDLAVLATAHFGVLAGDEIGAFLDASRDFALELRGKVEATLASLAREVSLFELLTELNPGVGEWPKSDSIAALAFPVVAHLEQLERDGKIRIRDSAGGALLSRAVTA